MDSDHSNQISKIMDYNLGGPLVIEVKRRKPSKFNETYEIALGQNKAKGGDIIQSNQVDGLKELGLEIMTVSLEHIYLRRTNT